MNRETEIQVSVQVGEETVTFKERGRSEYALARILGAERDADGQVQTVYLDRLMHNHKHASDHWDFSGPVTTVLHRKNIEEKVAAH